MTRERILAKNTMLYLVGSLSSKIIGFLFLLLFTRFLTPAEMGMFDLTINTIYLIVPIAALCSTFSILRFILDAPEASNIDRVLSNGLFIVGSGTMLALMVFLFISSLLHLEHALLIAATGAATAACTTWQQIARAFKENAIYSISGVLLSFLILASGFILLFVFGMGTAGMFLAFVLSPLIVFIFLEYKLKVLSRISFRHINKKTFKELVTFSLPLVPSELNWWLMSSANRYFIFLSLGAGANGLFSVSARFPSMLSMVNDLFNKAWFESAVTENHSLDRDQYFSKVFNIFASLQFSGLLVLLPLMRPVLSILVDSAYYTAWRYIPFLLLGSMFLAFANFYGAGYMLSGNTKGTFFSTLLAGVINCTFLLVLLGFIGLQAASLASCAAYLFLWLFRAANTRRYFHLKIDKKNIGALSAVLALYIAGYYLENPFVDILLLVIAVLLAYFSNREILGRVYDTLKARVRENEG